MISIAVYLNQVPSAIPGQSHQTRPLTGNTAPPAAFPIMASLDSHRRSALPAGVNGPETRAGTPHHQAASRERIRVGRAGNGPPPAVRPRAPRPIASPLNNLARMCSPPSNAQHLFPAGRISCAGSRSHSTLDVKNFSGARLVLIVDLRQHAARMNHVLHSGVVLYFAMNAGAVQIAKRDPVFSVPLPSTTSQCREVLHGLVEPVIRISISDGDKKSGFPPTSYHPVAPREQGRLRSRTGQDRGLPEQPVDQPVAQRTIQVPLSLGCTRPFAARRNCRARCCDAITAEQAPLDDGNSVGRAHHRSC